MLIFLSLEQVSVVDESKRNTVQQEVLDELSHFDNQSLPDVKLVPGPSVEFDEIEFDVPVTKTVELANVGQVRPPPLLSKWELFWLTSNMTVTRPLELCRQTRFGHAPSPLVIDFPDFRPHCSW